MTLLAPYLLIAFRELLSNTSGEQMIGRGGPTGWPVRFANLYSSDFHIWGHPNSTVRAVGKGSEVQGPAPSAKRTAWM
jgi:hypothetical protein